MHDAPPPSLARPIRVADLSGRHEVAFDIAPDPAALERLAGELGLLGLRKLRFSGRLAPEGRRDWRLDGMLGATVVQACVVTLAPVTTRLDEAVTRRFLARMPDPGPGEHEIDDDETEPLGETIDPAAVMVEALVLALPPWPRAAGADAAADALRGDDGPLKPFAGLAPLRDRLGPGTDGSDTGGSD